MTEDFSGRGGSSLSDDASDNGGDSARTKCGAHALASLQRTVEAGLVGRTVLVERLLIALLTGGHLLVEGPPGLAKTRAVKRLASGLASSFSRIQCTPDLMPADILGSSGVGRGSRANKQVAIGQQVGVTDPFFRMPPMANASLHVHQ